MANLAATTLATITRCWAGELGCPPEHFATGRTLAVPHKGFGDYHGVFFFRWFASLVVSLPASLLPAIGPRVEQLRADRLVPEGCLRAVGAEDVERVIGPAYYGYADAGCLRS